MPDKGDGVKPFFGREVCRGVLWGAILAVVSVPAGMVAGALSNLLGTIGADDAASWGCLVAAGLAAGACAELPATAGGASTAGAVGAWLGPVPAGTIGTVAHGGGPDWWAKAAAVYLGPNCLCADASPSVVITGVAPVASNETASQAFERFEVPTTTSEFRARKARRRGGYAPRPPPAARTAITPASVDLKLTESGYELLCEICYGTSGEICFSPNTSVMKLACLLILSPDISL
jgi:hypothetical protein